MHTTLSNLIEQFRGLRVTVIGDAMLDSYLEGTTNRICREAPVPVVTLEHRTDAPGGAANTAANVRSLGANVALLSVRGSDGEGRTLQRVLEQQGVATDHLLVHPARATITKHRLIAASHMLVRFDQGDATPLDPATEQAVLARLEYLFPWSDAVIISDYSYGVMTPPVMQTLAKLQARSPRVLVADSKHLRAYRHMGLTAAKPNFDEAVRVLGPHLLEAFQTRIDAMTANGERILHGIGAQIAAVTLDTDGALIFERGSPPYRTYARPTIHARAAGAGDTFVSALTLALATGATTPAAAELASAAAAAVVAKNGTVTCTAQDLHEQLTADGKYVADLSRLDARIALDRQSKRRIVFTNGCFDILHRGHVALLNRAKMLGDVLIVGVNSDASIQRLKGPERPVNHLEDRLQVLAALSCIDYIVSFDEDTPEHLINTIRPDVFVKGGDYSRIALPEAALVERLGGRVEILPYLENRSTTGLIERIRTTTDRDRAVGE